MLGYESYSGIVCHALARPITPRWQDRVMDDYIINPYGNVTGGWGWRRMTPYFPRDEGNLLVVGLCPPPPVSSVEPSSFLPAEQLAALAWTLGSLCEEHGFTPAECHLLRCLQRHTGWLVPLDSISLYYHYHTYPLPKDTNKSAEQITLAFRGWLTDLLKTPPTPPHGLVTQPVLPRAPELLARMHAGDGR